jgi:hypothetical protein
MRFTHSIAYILIMKEYTYHHLVYGVDYVVHLAPGDVSIVVHIVQSEGP